MKINIAIVDDHPMIIGGLESLLSGYPQLRLVAAYRSGSDLIAQLASVQADILLLDIQLQDKNGDLLVPVILKQRPDIKILVLTNNSSQLYIHNMLRMGASGYVLKSSEPDVLIGREVGNSASHPQHSVHRASRPIPTLHRLMNKLLAFLRQNAELADFGSA